MRQWFRTFIAVLVAALFLADAGAAFAQNDNTRVLVPNGPSGGALISGCYTSVGNIYGKYRFTFCLKRRGTYEVTGGGVRCDGRLNWSVSGLNVSLRLQRTSCGRRFSWSADTATCKPNLLLGILGLINKTGALSALECDYRPARGTNEKPIKFVARRS
jgi:hypothetical protein